MDRIFDDEICTLVRRALHIFPSNKYNTIQCDALARQSGYIQWHALHRIDAEVTSEPGARQSSVITLEEIPGDIDGLATDDRDAAHRRLHDAGQVAMGHMTEALVRLVHDNPRMYQAKLAQCAGLTREKYNDNNRIFATCCDIACDQGILKKIIQSNKRVTYELVPGAPSYRPIPMRVRRGPTHSSLEALLCDHLIATKCEFRQQVRPNGCRYKRQLSFDFEVALDDGTELLVEVQGRQHYEYIKHFHRDTDSFPEQLKKDAIKRQWAEDNDRELVEIRYDTNVVRYFDDYLAERDSPVPTL